MWCKEIRQFRKEFFKELAIELFEEKTQDTEQRGILDLIEDAIACLEKWEEDECEISPQYAGLRELFWGIVVKDWKGSYFNCTKYKVLNKILVYHAV